MGFEPVAKNKSKGITLCRQGDINYLLNPEKTGHAAQFVEDHGHCAPSMAWRVVDAQHALKRAVELGATEYIQRKGDDGFGEGNFKAIFESIEENQIRRGVLDVEPAA